MAESFSGRALARMRAIAVVARELMSDFDNQPILGGAVQMPLALAAGLSGGSGHIAGSTVIGVYLALKSVEAKPKMGQRPVLTSFARRSLEISSLVAAPAAPYVATAVSNMPSAVQVPAVLGAVGTAVVGRWRLITNYRDAAPATRL